VPPCALRRRYISIRKKSKKKIQRKQGWQCHPCVL
jgi:hypothetical protein